MYRNLLHVLYYLISELFLLSSSVTIAIFEDFLRQQDSIGRFIMVIKIRDHFLAYQFIDSTGLSWHDGQPFSLTFLNKPWKLDPLLTSHCIMKYKAFLSPKVNCGFLSLCYKFHHCGYRWICTCYEICNTLYALRDNQPLPTQIWRTSCHLCI